MDEVEEEFPVRSNSKKTLLVGAICLLVGAGGGFFGAGLIGGEAEAATASSEDGEQLTRVLNLGEFTIDLYSSAGGRKLQMNISVEGPDSAMATLEDRDAEVRDAILMLGSDLTSAQVLGMRNRMALKSEIETRLDTIVGEEGVDRVFLTNIVVQ